GLECPAAEPEHSAHSGTRLIRAVHDVVLSEVAGREVTGRVQVHGVEVAVARGHRECAARSVHGRTPDVSLVDRLAQEDTEAADFADAGEAGVEHRSGVGGHPHGADLGTDRADLIARGATHAHEMPVAVPESWHHGVGAHDLGVRGLGGVAGRPGIGDPGVLEDHDSVVDRVAPPGDETRRFDPDRHLTTSIAGLPVTWTPLATMIPDM